MSARARRFAARAVAGAVSALLLAGGLELASPAPALADTASPVAVGTVSADPLPTVQINGVAWSQAVVGNTVYVAGKFTSARPAGAAAGVGETTRNNLLAYDIRTGELITSFAPDLNGQAMVVTASPDGSRIYVGGDFTKANGQTRNRLAAYDTATGALVANFAPSVNGQVTTIAASSAFVYLGGKFSAVGTTSRTRLAAVSAANGALASWAPVPGYGSTAGNQLPLFDKAGQPIPGTSSATNKQTSNNVLDMVLTNGGTQVVIAGRFDSLNGVKATGVGAVDAFTGATKAFAINKLITNQGINSGVYSLYTDGTTVYGTGYDYYGPGNLESTFAATAAGGAVVWVADCRGDTYDVYAAGGAVYTASHAHDCANIGSFPEQTPDRVHMYANAFTAVKTGVNVKISQMRNNLNLTGQASPSRLAWAPTFYSGTYTGQQQAGWTIAGNADYVVYGGEFPGVNGSSQQGLVRFAVRPLAKNKVAPRATSAFTPTATMLDGAVRLSWKTVSDRDDEYLTYSVYRDGGTTPVCSVTTASEWWRMPVTACQDTSAPAGAHSYVVTAADPTGNKLSSTTTTATVPAGSSGAARPYAAAVAADGASGYWTLGGSAATLHDRAGTADLVAGAGVTRGQAGALSGDADTAASFSGTSTGFASTQSLVAGPQVFSLEAWVQTTSTRGGRIVGFGNAKTGSSTYFDRQLWLDATGKANFGIWTGAETKVTSPAALNDGKWHHVVATKTLSAITLYVDGVQVATKANTAWAQRYSGYWRIGGDVGWANSGASYLSGRIDEVAVYPTALAPAQVAGHVTVARSGVLPNRAPTAAFTATVDHQDVAFDATGSTDADGTVAGYAWSFGDGTTGTGRTVQHSYATPGTRTVTLVVTDDDGATATRSATVTTTTAPPNTAPTAAFTAAGSGHAVAFDGSGSADADGTVASWSWAFGDGATGSGRTTSHTYAADGSYAVTLTVADDDGATAAVQRTVVVTGAVLASDAFDRTVTGGLGSADVGGAWTASAGPTRQSVSGGSAALALTAGTNTGSYLGAVAQSDVDVRTDVTLSAAATGGGANVSVVGRRVGADQEYRARLRVLADGRVMLAVTKLAGSATETLVGTEVAVPGLTYAPGTALQVRFTVAGTGTTRLTASVWAAGAAEPATPTVSRTDTTASLQAAGGVGLTGYLSASATAPVTVRVGSLVVTPVA